MTHELATSVDRRSFLRRASAAGAAGVVLAATEWRPLRALAAKDWSDPTAWPDGVVPGAGDHAEVTTDIVLTSSVSVGSVEITGGSSLTFDAGASVTLTTTGNVVVAGTLVMRPASTVTHVLRFADVDESSFVGGGMAVLASDVGLWVIGAGQLDIAGTAKKGWAHASSDPTWSATDQLIQTPTVKEDYEGFKTVSLGSALPTVNGTWTAEVLNLTRNVRIEGSASGRAHIIVRSSQPQYIQYAELAYLGPEGILGRYPLHFHHTGDGSRGSVVTGVVSRHSRNHAFVPHVSHGITFTDCVAYDTVESAFWWDKGDETDDTVWDTCIAAKVADTKTANVAGFMLNGGTGNVVRDSVAVGVVSGDNASGFWWPSQANGLPNTWVFEGNTAHNNSRHGIFVWQNTSTLGHVIDDYAAYHCGLDGIHHGAYSNVGYSYQNSTLYRNGRSGLSQHAQTNPTQAAKFPGRRLSFERLTFIGSSYAVRLGSHNAEAGVPTLYRDCGFELQAQNKVLVDEGTLEPGHYDFVNCGLEPSDFDISVMRPGSLIRVQRANGTAYQIDHTGAVTTIAAFDGARGGFIDVPPSHWAYAPITAVAAAGIALGYSDGTFRPGELVTRAQAVVFVGRAAALPNPLGATSQFRDVPQDHWAFGPISAAVAAGIAAGREDGTFGPGETATRAHIAAFIFRAIGEKENPTHGGAFTDVPASAWFAGVVERLAELGVIAGYEDGTFRPNENTSRAQMAAMISRAWKL